MTLVYRAIWEDPDIDPVEALGDAFSGWCEGKGIDPASIPSRGAANFDGDRLVEVRRADAEIGRALRCVLSEMDGQGRTWTTTATALAEESTNTLWVDLDCQDPDDRPAEMAAPRLVRDLLANGKAPTSFGLPLRSDARVPPPEAIAELLETLLDPSRQIPIVVFSPDRRFSPDATINRAKAAASTLAGLAHVYALSPSAEDALNAGLPSTLRVYGGAVRLYLPGIDPEGDVDAYRHRVIPLRLIASHPRRAAAMLSSHLARLQQHPPVPPMWGRLGVLLQRPSDQEIGDRANEIQIERGISAADSTAQELASEVESLTLLLAEADLELAALRASSNAQTVDLTRQLAGLQNEQYADADALEELARERDGLIRVIRAMTAGDRQVEDASDHDPLALPIPQSVEDAVELARQHLAYVAIPESALENLDELDATPKYAVWASTIWTGLVALNEYAKSKFEGEQHPGFKLWCDSTGMWPSNKLAMTESDSVQNRARFSDQRKFGVSGAVSADGSIQMYSHLQIQKGGGDNIPRVYFYDDTDGATKMFHVGFIGPHYCVRNTRS